MEEKDFEALVDFYYSMIYSILHKYSVPNDDFYQIALIALWNAYQKYDPQKGKFITFAYSQIQGAVRSELRKVYRDAGRQIPKDPLLLGHDEPTEWNDSLIQQELFTFCYHILTPVQKKWFIGTFEEHKKLSEIAEKEGVKIETVKSWRKAALKNLRKYQAEIKGIIKG